MAPVVDLTLAAELGLPPTPSPRGRPIALLGTVRPLVDLPAALMALDSGVVVRDLPGLHTQGSHRWTYALVVPDAQVVRAGHLAGRVSVRLRGNLLDQLNAEATCLVRLPGSPTPALLLTERVAVESA